MLKTVVYAAVAGAVVLGASVSSPRAEGIQIPADAPDVVQDEITRRECGDCHMVFPPHRLPQNSWRKIIGDLENHFGENAALDADTGKHIEDYLVANAMDTKASVPVKMRLAAWKKRGIVDPVRITELPEWTRHHTAKEKYKRMTADVGYTRGSNCIKCHKGAEKGYFEEFPGY